MDLAFSSVAARVATVQGRTVTYFDADRPELQFKSSLAQLPYLFTEDYDFTVIKHSTEKEALGRLLSGWNIDRGLRMLQIVLDEDSADLWTEAIICLESLLAKSDCRTGIENFVSAVPVPSKPDWERIKEISIDHKAVRAFVDKLANAQQRILEVRNAWLSVPANFFVEHRTRFQFEMMAIVEGAFRRLVFEDQMFAALECYKIFRTFPNGRQIVAAWISPLRLSGVRAPMPSEEPDIEDDHDFQPTEREQSNRQLYVNALQQQSGIIDKLKEGDLGKAERFASDLVKSQLAHSGPKYAAKSLCSIAQEAKKYGRYDLQLEWVTWATEIAPNDSRALGQAGDAYLQLWKLNQAQAAYEKAVHKGNENFGEIGLAKVLRARGRFEEALEAFSRLKGKYGIQDSNSRAWSTYAEVLRDLSRFEEALQAYDEARAAYPNEAAMWCGRAAVLGEMGRLQEALAGYELALTRFPNDVVPICGRADILKQMGRLDEALVTYGDAITRFPDDPVPLCGKADVLRNKGAFELAKEGYGVARSRFPFEPVAYTGYAETLRDGGRPIEASAAYDEAAQKFPFDEHCRNGRANVLKVAGRFEDALQEYERNVRDFPYSLYALSGRAHLLKELGYPERALEAYDSHSSCRS